jgi:predicted nucleic acid-binding protein
MGSSVNTAQPRVYLDTNVFITAFEHAGARSDHAWWVLEAVEDGEIIGATSEITLAEVLVKPMERGATDLANAYEKMIRPGPNFEILPVSRDVLVAAAGIRARRSSVRLPDAVHIATARALDCAAFVSDDRRLRVPEDMRLLELNAFTLDDILGERP